MWDNKSEIEGNLIVNQDLVKETLNTLKSHLRVIKNEKIGNRAEFKELLWIQEDLLKRKQHKGEGYLRRWKWNMGKHRK